MGSVEDVGQGLGVRLMVGRGRAMSGVIRVDDGRAAGVWAARRARGGP